MTDDKVKLSAWLFLIALGLGVIILVVVTTIQRNGDEHLSQMHLTGTTVDDKNYCADFVADEADDDKVKITITNCGDMRIAIKPKHSSKREVLGSKEQYTVTLDSGSNFSANILSTRGDYFGAFTF